MKETVTPLSVEFVIFKDPSNVSILLLKFFKPLLPFLIFSGLYPIPLSDMVIFKSLLISKCIEIAFLYENLFFISIEN